MARPLDQAPRAHVARPRFTIRRLPVEDFVNAWGEDPRPWKVTDALAPAWIGHAGSLQGALRVCLYAAIPRRRQAGETPADAVGERVALNVAERDEEREREARNEQRIRERIYHEERAIRRKVEEEERDRMAGVAWSMLTGGR